MEDREVDKRIVKKLGVGALMVVPIYGLGAILTSGSGAEGFGAGVVFEFTVLFGYPVGAAIGVSRIDPYDRFIHSLVGSAVGWYVGAILTGGHNFAYDSRWETWPFYICPLVGATILSEKFRKPPESPHLSVGLKPDPRGHLLAVVSWRF